MIQAQSERVGTYEVLLVEDGDIEVPLYRSVLTIGGYTVRVASSVVAAQQACQASEPDCIVLDYHLPDGTGVDLLRAMADHHYLDEIAVVMLTGNGDEDRVATAMKLGTDDYLSKSGFTAERLLRRVENAIEKAGLRRQHRLDQEALVAKNAELDQFARTAAHDLRAPLRGITAFLGMLERDCTDELSDDGKRYVARCVGAAARMDGLIEDLLGYARAGSTDITAEEVALDEVLAEALDQLDDAIYAANAEVFVAAPLPVLYGSRAMLTQLFQNLVGNAVKYRREKHPEVSVSATVNGSDVTVVVADNGIGIDPEYFEKIFEPFQRLHSQKTYEGSGVGLATVKRIVERHGGHIEVRSVPGEGSQFVVRLPKLKPPCQ